MENSVNEGSHSHQPFEFTGKAVEYFSIWIVNVVLSILTIGIYSAWAKVRTNQYFYGNTLLDGNAFRYTANPVQILKGRIVALVLFLIYYFASLSNPIIAGTVFLFIMLLVPAFVVMSMAFRLRNSVYRNVRFNFQKDFLQAYKVFFVPILFAGGYIFLVGQIEHLQTDDAESSSNLVLAAISIALVIGIFTMLPWWEFIITRFKVVHSQFGNSDFSYTASVKNFYGMYLMASLFSILVFGVIGLLIAGIVQFGLTEQGEDPSAAIFGSLPLLMLLILPAYLWLFAYFQAKRTNLIFGNLRINGHQLNSEMKTGYLLYLYITNTLVIMLTLGLMLPWAKIRTAKYKASVTSMTVAGDLNQFVTTQEQQQSAMGEEIGEMFDLDIGF